MELHKRLIKLRQKRGLTQLSFSKILGVKRVRYNAWEQAISEPDVHFLYQIADFYSVSVDYLIGRTNMANAEFDRVHTLEQNFRIIQRAALTMSIHEREKALELWEFIFNETVTEARKEEIIEGNMEGV